jgi:hypothetical protein
MGGRRDGECDAHSPTRSPGTGTGAGGAPSPAQAGAWQSYFVAVASVPHSSQLWATGVSVTDGAQSTLTERWDGRRWIVTASPNASADQGFLSAVATTRSQARAVGSSTTLAGVTSTLIEHRCG